LPIPLGCIAVRRNLGKEVISDIEQRLKNSIELAFAYPEKTQDYVRAHAQELDDGVMEEHIKTYVNTFTRGLGEEGRAAVTELEKRAFAAGVIS
jgi:1,4-dihydroxy-6-naphthoate synthase